LSSSSLVPTKKVTFLMSSVEGFWIQTWEVAVGDVPLALWAQKSYAPPWVAVPELVIAFFVPKVVVRAPMYYCYLIKPCSAMRALWCSSRS
jgi:hypothetical protein